jgi:hypothetical protein
VSAINFIQFLLRTRRILTLIRLQSTSAHAQRAENIYCVASLL